MTPAPVHLVSVNKTPQRAAVLVESMVAELRPRFNIVHVANSSDIASLRTIISSLVMKPDLMICSSQWTAEEQHEIRQIAMGEVPNIKVVAIPPGLDAMSGGDAIVAFLLDAVRNSGIPLAAE